MDLLINRVRRFMEVDGALTPSYLEDMKIKRIHFTHTGMHVATVNGDYHAYPYHQLTQDLKDEHYKLYSAPDKLRRSTRE